MDAPCKQRLRALQPRAHRNGRALQAKVACTAAESPSKWTRPASKGCVHCSREPIEMDAPCKERLRALQPRAHRNGRALQAQVACTAAESPSKWKRPASTGCVHCSREPIEMEAP